MKCTISGAGPKACAKLRWRRKQKEERPILMFSWVTSFWDKVAGATHMVTPEEIEGALHLPVLAIIPHLERRRSNAPLDGSRVRRIDLEGRWRSRLLSYFSDNSPAAMAYHSLVNDLHQRSREQRQKVWLLTA